ncbi:hypothetical protein THRCLA_10449 [Thraustotheca clavata]|uniref:Uncharacterized protein n=1 Tax=Thraustotheca clavata TaxID=74557 RepID=A0A1V9YPH0_9STRA|nr:hypothetical protein THRCLA_10449 [Thraustotheca clavata]
MASSSGGLQPMPQPNGLPLDTTKFDTTNVLGLTITIFAAIISNLGVQLQKQAHCERNQSTNYFSQRQWIVGLAFVILGSIGDFEALSFATQSLVATVGGGTTVVTNVLFSAFWHGESITLQDIYGTCCILLGVILIAISSPEDEQYNIEQLIHRFKSPVVLCYILLLACTMVYLLHIIKSDTSPKPQIPNSSSFPVRIQSRFRRFLKGQDSSFNLQPTLYAAVSGIMGSLSVLLGKCASEMIKTTLKGSSQFTHPITYFFFGGMVGTVLLQIHWFNQALILGDIAVVFPIFQVFWIAFGVVGGMVFYGDLVRLEFFQGISFLLAFACILVGVYYLAQHEPAKIIPSDKLLLAHDDTKPEHECFYLEQATQVLLDPATMKEDDVRLNDSAEMLNDIRKPYRPPALFRSV